MKKVTLYQLSSTGKTKVWTIEVYPTGMMFSHATILTTSGELGGKMTPTETVIRIGKGKNTPFEQAVSEATSKLNKQIKKGYVEDINQIKASTERASGVKAPMKGERYHPTGAQTGSKTLDQLGLRGKMIGQQRKLDGFRYRIVINKSTCKFHSSSGDLVPAFPQVEKQLRKAFDKNIAYWEKNYGVTEYTLDGEMYNHELVQKKGFEAIQKACGTRIIDANTPAYTMGLRDQLEFHLFDVVLNAPYTTREKILPSFIDGKSVVEVETIKFIADEKIIDDYNEQFLAEGYEGTMLRVLDQPYEHKKGRQLLKYKPLLDAEFLIVGKTKSVTGDTLGALILQDESGNQFNSDLKGAMGTDAAKQEIWDNFEKNYKGKYVTVDFLNYTAAGIPRHPKARNLRKGPSQD